MDINVIHNEDCRLGLMRLPDKSVDCCVTSPPYYGLRDYGHTDQIGLESSPESYVQQLVSVFNEVKRVLKDEGTLWLNLGDSYAGSCKGQTSDGKQSGDPRHSASNNTYQIRQKRGRKENNVLRWGGGNIPAVDGLKPKDLIGIPWMIAFALRSAGWYLRQDIIWYKPNPMPESVTDRCTKSHEYIFLLSKSAKYYYDQDSIKQPVADATISRMSQQLENQKGSERVPDKSNGNMKAVGPGRIPRKAVDVKGGNQASEKGIQAMALNGSGVYAHSGYFNRAGELIGGGLANKKSVWTVATTPFKEAHFATFPSGLIIDCIKAGCPVGGLVLDPFMGSGTTAIVARKLNRNYVGFELSKKYMSIQKSRIDKELGMFK